MSVAEYSRHVGDVTAMRSPVGEGVLIKRMPDGGLEIEVGLYAAMTFGIDMLREEGGDAVIVADRAADVIEAQAAVLVAAIRAHLRRFQDDLGDDLPPEVDETTVKD